MRVNSQLRHPDRNRAPDIVQTPRLKRLASGDHAAVERSFGFTPPLERSLSLAEQEPATMRQTETVEKVGSQAGEGNLMRSPVLRAIARNAPDASSKV